MVKIKPLLKSVIPPILITLIKKLIYKRGIEFKGDYSTWKRALSDVDKGYETPDILERVREASLKVKNGEAVFERDSVCFGTEDYRWPILSCLLYISAINQGSLKVIDFGGSLGSFYNQHRKFFDRLNSVSWYVVEQADFVKCGQDEFETDTIKFRNSISDCLEESKIDVVLCSSVLQYLELPYLILAEIIKANPDFIIVDRTAFIEQSSDRLTIQNVPPSIYEASYPAWFLSNEKFNKYLGDHGYKLTMNFLCDEDFGIGEFRWMMFEKC